MSPCTLNRPAYLQLLQEDLAWLLQQPRTLERDHVADLLSWIIRANSVGGKPRVNEPFEEIAALRADCKRKDEALRKADRGSTCRWCGNHFQWWKDIRAALADSDNQT